MNGLSDLLNHFLMFLYLIIVIICLSKSELCHVLAEINSDTHFHFTGCLQHFLKDKNSWLLASFFFIS